MKTPQLLCSAACVAAIALSAGCNRARTDEEAERTASRVRGAAARAADQLADSWLTTKIQAQYFADEDVKARYINVSTRDGQVTLSGRVENKRAREQAVQIARNTDGVRDVTDRLTIGLARADDAPPERMDAAWITTKIQAQYFLDDDISSNDINVDTANGVVTLSGRVDTDVEKTRAVEIARATEGVTHVEDRLAVGGAAVATTGETPGLGEQVDDLRITSTIQSKFFLDDTVKGRHINVDTRQGVVTLRGEVGSEGERTQALQIARSTEGVQRVEDALTINDALAPQGRPAPRPDAAAGRTDTATPRDAAPQPQPAGTRVDDAMITTKLQAKFFLDDQVKAGNIDITTQNGIVTLEGSVPNEAARKRALEIAQQAEGVLQIVDRLMVKE